MAIHPQERRIHHSGSQALCFGSFRPWAPVAVRRKSLSGPIRAKERENELIGQLPFGGGLIIAVAGEGYLSHAVPYPWK